MDWSALKTWPNANLSRRTSGPVHRWHVQEAGKGQTLLLLHGAGGSTHNFRDMIEPLSKAYHVVAIDLPGQGFTQLGARHRCGLDPMAQDITALCVQEEWEPRIIVGHSAGGAIALRMAMPDLSPRGQQPLVIGINAALGEFPGLAGFIFPLMAKALAAVPFTARLFSGASANPARIKALINATGSELDQVGLDLYRRLVADRNHVDATLLMMAQWKLQPLLDALKGYDGPVRFIVGEKDATVPPTVSLGIAQSLSDATVTNLPDLGHLAHEERPDQIANLILDMAKQQGL
ncbi:alpha/beta fold hydrolase BchO [uncultured Tateyamaria sp.]|uniref:alpha/beta fold hydrolase BchO n=1 Tax=uncultured Tateyamaria sp. TaxID=455651 RepID=UPI00262232F6|nr:alpha/beta fold hydrolase BchO [uncultured Tateyamaria sp.]